VSQVFAGIYPQQKFFPGTKRQVIMCNL